MSGDRLIFEPPPIVDDPRSILAAEMLPDEWNRWAHVQGKMAGKYRTAIRKKAEAALKLRQLETSGAQCATCSMLRYTAADGVHCYPSGDHRPLKQTIHTALCDRWSAKNPA